MIDQSPASAGEDRSATHLLHPGVRDWMAQRGWTELRPIQEHTINTLRGEDYSDVDYLISAPTAGGKTMAALLPLCSRWLEEEDARSETGFHILFVSPLKALIRQQADQANDISSLSEAVARAGNRAFGCSPWNSDVDDGRKKNIWTDPSGILLITPESIEGRLLHDPIGFTRVFAPVRFIVIDELHAYFDTPRGRHLISLLARLEARLGRRIPRICLSATLGNASSVELRDHDIARIGRFIRPASQKRPVVITETGKLAADDAILEPEIAFDLHLNVIKGEAARRDATAAGESSEEDNGPDIPLERQTLSPGQREIAKRIDKLFSGFGRVENGKATPPLTALVFANTRHNVETYTSELNRISTKVAVSEAWKERQKAARPGDNPRREATHRRFTDLKRYWTHHRSLDKAERHHAETRMTSGEIGCILVCTTTLELGIDVGTIENVVQIGPGPSVSSLRQRLGRSRRAAQQDAQYGKGSDIQPRLDMFVHERSGTPEGVGLLDSLHLQTFQALAQLVCLKERAYESPRATSLDLSTLVQQILCVLKERGGGGVSWGELRELLTVKGPFQEAAHQKLFDATGDCMFDAIVDHLRDQKNGPRFIKYDPEGGRPRDEILLYLDDRGEKEVKRPSIYAAFSTVTEFTVRAPGRKIGSIDVRSPVSVGDFITLGSQGWEVTGVDRRRLEIQVRPSRSGRAPRFPGDPIPVSGLVVRKMRTLYNLEADTLSECVNRAEIRGESVVDTLRDGLEAFRAAGLETTDAVERDGDVYVFPWAGYRHVNAYLAVLRACMLPAAALGPVVVIPGTSLSNLAQALEDRWPKLAQLPAHELVRGFVTKPNGKFDHCLAPIFWRHDFVSDRLSETEVRKAADRLMTTLRQTRPRRMR